MATIFRKHRASLPTLPVEILHQIFSELDGTTVLLSVRNVCRQLREVTKTHHRYELDLTSLSKPSFHQLLTLIHPDYVTNLTVSDGELTPGQVGLFCSLVDIDLFTRLRSLTLLNILEEDLCSFLNYASRCSLTSLTIDSRLHYSKQWNQIIQLLSSIIGQPSFLHLELINESVSQLITKSPLLVQCKLRYLRLTGDMSHLLCGVINHFPDLETLVLDRIASSLINFLHAPED
jgi:hypothetical protein